MKYDGGFEEYLMGALGDYLDNELYGEGIMGCSGSTQKSDGGVRIAMDDGRIYKVTLECEGDDRPALRRCQSRHQKRWVIGPGWLWCYECGAIRLNVRAGEDRWTYPVGPDGENPAIQQGVK